MEPFLGRHRHQHKRLTASRHCRGLLHLPVTRPATPLTDIMCAYRLTPARLVRAIRWDKLCHPFLSRTIATPPRLGVEAKEISSPLRTGQIADPTCLREVEL